MVTFWFHLFRGAGKAVSRRTSEPRGDGSLWLRPGLGRPAGLCPEGPAPAGEAGLSMAGCRVRRKWGLWAEGIPESQHVCAQERVWEHRGQQVVFERPVNVLA